MEWTAQTQLLSRDDLKSLDELVFCDFLDTSTMSDVKVYHQVKDPSVLADTLRKYLQEHNSIFRKNPMNIVMFRMATLHTSHLVRVMNQVCENPRTLEETCTIYR